MAVKPAMEPGKKVIGREEIERVVRSVMESEEGKILRHRLKELKNSASRALEKGGSSYDALSSVVEKWKADN